MTFIDPIDNRFGMRKQRKKTKSHMTKIALMLWGTGELGSHIWLQLMYFQYSTFDIVSTIPFIRSLFCFVAFWGIDFIRLRFRYLVVLNFAGDNIHRTPLWIYLFAEFRKPQSVSFGCWGFASKSPFGGGENEREWDRGSDSCNGPSIRRPFGLSVCLAVYRLVCWFG